MSEGTAQLDELRSRLTEEIRPLNALALDGITLADAEARLREVADLKVRLTGKKSDLASIKKQIGSVLYGVISAYECLVVDELIAVDGRLTRTEIISTPVKRSIRYAAGTGHNSCLRVRRVCQARFAVTRILVAKLI